MLLNAAAAGPPLLRSDPVCPLLPIPVDMLLGTRVMHGKVNFGADGCVVAATGAGGLGGKCDGVPYLAMLFCNDDPSPDWEAIGFIDDPLHPLPCMLCGDPKDGVEWADGLGRGI